MPEVLRWGRSAYEGDAAMELERGAAESLGLSWELREDRSDPGDLQGVRALVVNSGVRVSAEILSRFEGSLVLTTTSGREHIDVDAAAARGVAVGRCPMARRDPVVEQSLSWLIALMRRFPALDGAAREGRWARGALLDLGGRGLSGSRILVVGAGVIGRQMIALLSAMGAEVWCAEQDGVEVPSPACRVELDAALPSVDAVTLHCGLTPTSANIMSAERIARLAPHAVLVNTARGGVLDVEAAVTAVRTGALRGLGVDVFPVEPYPQLAAGAAVEGVLFSPHASGYRHDLSRRVAAEVAATLVAWHKGAPLPHRVLPLR